MKLSSTLAEIEQEITKLLEQPKKKYITLPANGDEDGNFLPSTMFELSTDPEWQLMAFSAYRQYNPTYH